MRITGYTDKTGQKNHLFTSLVQECQLANPGSRLSEKLRKKIEEFGRDERREVVSKTTEGCAPLFLACRNGSAEVADYLLKHCNAPLEQKGLFEVLDEGVSHSVTPLWCAAVSGRLSVVKVLLEHGADVNSVSDTGSTPVRSACYIVRPGLNTSHMEIIRALVEAGADIKRPNHFGGTCLINSVQSPPLVEFLLCNGADPNAEDVQRKTALHYAVQEHRIETARLLLEKGADPFRKSKYGDDILQTACIKGALLILNYLLDTVEFPVARVCDAFELIGSTFILDMQDMGSTLFFWRKALEIRNEGMVPVPKQYLGVHPVLGVHEFASRRELDVLSFDMSQMRLQALLITERILGSHHKDTIFRFMYAGAAHADSNEYQPCITLWNYALQLKIQKETLLSSDTSFTIRAVIQLFINIYIREEGQKDLKFKDVANTTRCINEGLGTSVSLLRILPQYKVHVENFDMVLNSWLHLILLLIKLTRSEEDKEQLHLLVESTRKIAPKSSNGDTLLHLAVSSHAAVRSNSFLDDDTVSLFPSQQVVSYLLSSGFSVHERNQDKETPLHISSMKENYTQDIAELLLEHGAHVDSYDCMGLTPLLILRTHPAKLNVMKYISLKCLASLSMRRRNKKLKPGDAPQECLNFYSLHL